MGIGRIRCCEPLINEINRRWMMFELPECVTSPHKFVWYNRTEEEFSRLISGKTVGETFARGRWLFMLVEPGFVLLFGECGGKILYHLPGSKMPKKYHLCLTFEDDSFLTATTQMWGAMELYERGAELNREYIKGMKPTPVEPDFSFRYFDGLIETLVLEKKRSAKSLLTQEQTIPGLGNAIAQDILFRARLHPRHASSDLDIDQRRGLFDAIVGTVDEVIEKGGRYDEYDLYGNRGRYIRIMDRRAAGNPCPICGTLVEKIQYLGGACYLCPACQN
jgi:formamidopyrimidine-DNA glycosylase